MLPALAQGQGVPAGGGDAPSVYEWRQYSLRTGAATRRLDDYLQNALVPALNRLGHSPIGVFQATFGLPTPTVCVLTPSTAGGGAESLFARESKLDRDEAYLKAAAPYLDATAADPVYVRQEISLLAAFPQFPHISVPVATAAKGPRMFELRTYESHNENAGLKKIEMFEKGGEIGIFRRVGLAPVFFGRNTVGPRLPSLTYMLVFPDLATREKNWGVFRDDPEWTKLRASPGLSNAEILSNINVQILRPTDYSQV